MTEKIVEALKEIRDIHQESEIMLKARDKSMCNEKDIENLNLVIGFFEGVETDSDKLEESIYTLEKIRNINNLALSGPNIIPNQNEINPYFEAINSTLEFVIDEIKSQIDLSLY